MLFVAVVDGSVSLISLSDFSSLVYRNSIFLLLLQLQMPFDFARRCCLCLLYQVEEPRVALIEDFGVR